MPPLPRRHPACGWWRERAGSAGHRRAPQRRFVFGEELAAALATLSDDERLALQLFVVDGMPAADVARLVRWPNAKAVYNRTYRALAALRARFVRQGIGLGDL